VNLAASLIAVSLLLLIALGVVALFTAGTDSRSSNADDRRGPKEQAGSGAPRS